MRVASLFAHSPSHVFVIFHVFNLPKSFYMSAFTSWLPQTHPTSQWSLPVSDLIVCKNPTDDRKRFGSLIMMIFGLTYFLFWKVEVEAGKKVLVSTWAVASPCWTVLRGGPHVLWPCPNSAGPPPGVLEVVAAPAQPEEGEAGTEVSIFCQLLFHSLVILPSSFVGFLFLHIP